MTLAQSADDRVENMRQSIIKKNLRNKGVTELS